MTSKEALEFLETHDNFTILTHKSPDGDTLGAGFGLCEYLRKIGKKANVYNNENFPMRYSFLYDGYYVMEFEEQTIVAVDIADTTLLGNRLARYADKIDLCIDHHISNQHYAKHTLLDGTSSAACLVIYEMLRDNGRKINSIIAKCFYTGIATDTGCFKFENTTPQAHIAAAQLLSYDIGYAKINRMMFDVKSKGRVMVEQTVIGSMEYYFDDKVTLITITTDLIKESGIDPSEFEGLASVPMQVDGVVAGITIKQRDTNRFKISLRTTEQVDASDVCGKLGGGGHIRAAGCEIIGSLNEVKEKILSELSAIVNKQGGIE